MVLKSNTFFESSKVLLIKITCGAWLIAKLFSWKLWTNDRVFPIVPIFESTPNFSNQTHFSLYFLSLLGLIMIFFFTKNKIIISLFLSVEIISCALDLMRWQPWEYQYLLVFLFFLISKKNTHEFQNRFLILLIATYIFSGFHKCNGDFLYRVWDNMILRNIFNFSNLDVAHSGIHYFGLIFPFIEISIGFGLLFSLNKKSFASLAILTHLLILIAFSPFVLDTNHIVLPWNLLMIGYVWIMYFYQTDNHIPKAFFIQKTNLVIVLFVIILPISNFFGWYNSYFSFNLYGGNTKQMVICNNNLEVETDLKIAVTSNNILYFRDFKNILNPNKLALTELKVPICPDVFVYKKLKKAWENKFFGIKNTFILFWYPYKQECIEKI